MRWVSSSDPSKRQPASHLEDASEGHEDGAFRGARLLVLFRRVPAIASQIVTATLARMKAAPRRRSLVDGLGQCTVGERTRGVHLQRGPPTAARAGRGRCRGRRANRRAGRRGQGRGRAPATPSRSARRPGRGRGRHRSASAEQSRSAGVSNTSMIRRYARRVVRVRTFARHPLQVAAVAPHRGAAALVVPRTYLLAQGRQTATGHTPRRPVAVPGGGSASSSTWRSRRHCPPSGGQTGHRPSSCSLITRRAAAWRSLAVGFPSKEVMTSGP